MSKRKIKFRVWDVEAKRMIGAKQTPLAAAVWTQTEPDDFVLMQYTGLKDVAGKEIFEGDLISHNQDAQRVDVYKIQWDEFEQFHARDVDPKRQQNVLEYWWLGKFWKQICIVGNVHENPELLK